jgi:hypothetical protein
MESVKMNPALCVYGIFGVNDPNRIEAGVIDGLLPKETQRCFARFGGGHEWAPPERMEEAIDWVVFNALTKLDISGNGTAFLRSTIDDALESVSQSRIKGAFALSNLIVILETRKLKNNEVFKTQAAKIEAALAKLTTDTNISNELAARNEYEILATEEASALGRKRMFKANKFMIPATEESAAMCIPDDGKPDPALILEELPKRYDACAKKYPGTFYGRWAAVKSKVVPLPAAQNKCPRGNCVKIIKTQ